MCFLSSNPTLTNFIVWDNNPESIDLFYGDSDTDMIAALKAGVHPVRVIRNEASIIEYGSNYFGNTLKGDSPEAPFSNNELKIFYKSKIGVFGESIYPIIWKGPN